MADDRLSSWLAWYRFARWELDYTHFEAVAYANLRAAPDLNRSSARAGRTDHA
jgi:adenosine deaminase